MKLAISGKGGVGKSTLAATLALLLAEGGEKVLAVDADPDANLAAAFGLSAREQAEIIPVAQRKALIEERTGAKVNQYGQIFKINPEVSDIAMSCGTCIGNVVMLVLGAVDAGNSGCACPESILLKALVTDLVLHKNESLILDMEAGVEHLGRATARGVNTMLVVVEPGQRSIDCAIRVKKMAAEIGVKDVRAIANKIASPEDEAFIKEALGDIPLLAAIPYSDAIRKADRAGCSVLENMDNDLKARFTSVLTQLRGEDA